MIFWLKSDLARELEKNPERFLEEGSARSAEDLFVRAVAAQRLGEAGKAQAILRKSLQYQINYVPSLYALSLINFELRNFDQAQRWFVRAVTRDDEASKSVLYIQKRLRVLLDLPTATQWASWCLRRLEEHEKADENSLFELGKTLFEQSQFAEAIPYLKQVVHRDEHSFEATQYLSYIYEHLYQGEELIEKTLDLATQTDNRADLFFNLAMVCQHEQRRPDLSLHFFYLASLSDPDDPGLKFSLEQSAIEIIGELNEAKHPEDFANLMVAHFHQGSIAVAERYAAILRDRFQWRFPFHFLHIEPSSVWRNWLLNDRTPLHHALENWFEEKPANDSNSIDRSSRS